jgi:hypothetical protein
MCAACRVADAIPSWLLALGFYVVVAILTIGWFAIRNPGAVCACVGTADPSQYMWSMEWWPHAIGDGINPFVTHFLWAPTGVNLAKAATIPTAALLMTPVTLTFGPIVSYNLVAIASPALSAFTAYLLCRRIAKRELPAFVGGFLFGFSSYEFAQLMGHTNLFVTFLIPPMVHLTLRRVDREISRLVYIVVMAVLFALQVGLSTELLAEVVMLGIVLLACTRFLASEPHRSRIAGLAAEAVGAGVLAVVVTSPFLYYALISGGFPPTNPELAIRYGTDFANLIFPTDVNWVGHHRFEPLWITFEKGSLVESDGYVGVALLIAFAVWFFSGARKKLVGKLLAITVIIAVVMSFGSKLHVAGIETVPMPFDVVKSLPVFDSLVPSRIMLFATLAIAIAIAAWLARPDGHRLARWALALLGAFMIFPNVAASLYGVPQPNPHFFSTSIYRRYSVQNEMVLVLPYGAGADSTLWQAETGFYFRMPEGYVSSTIPSPFDAEPGVAELWANIPPKPATFDAFLRAHHVGHIVVESALAGPWPTALAELGLHARSVGGVLLYEVPRRLSAGA